MLRTTLITLAAATGIGLSAASAAPVNGTVITTAVYENGAVQQVQAHDLEGADALLPQMKADTLLADKAFDADERVIEPLLAAGKTPVIPSKSNRKTPRDFDREMYKARHVIESFICKIKQFRAIATRYDKTARNFLAGIQLVASVILLN